MIEKGIINLNWYSSKINAPVVRSDSEVTFPKEEENVAFYPFFRCVFFVRSVV